MPAAEAARPISLAQSKDLFGTLAFHAHVALAVSGGGDSVALMWLAARWARTVPDAPKISILTVDHGLRPEAAAECATVVRWAEALGLEDAVAQAIAIALVHRICQFALAGASLGIGALWKPADAAVTSAPEGAPGSQEPA